MAKLLRDKVALVTGASRGIGRAIAVTMADEGAKVALTGRDIGRLNEVKEQIQVVGGQSDIWKMDVSSETEVEQSVNKILDSWGQIDILVNNAGIIHPDTPVWRTSISDWDDFEDMVHLIDAREPPKTF